MWRLALSDTAAKFLFTILSTLDNSILAMFFCKITEIMIYNKKQWWMRKDVMCWQVIFGFFFLVLSVWGIRGAFLSAALEYIITGIHFSTFDSEDSQLWNFGIYFKYMNSVYCQSFRVESHILSKVESVPPWLIWSTLLTGVHFQLLIVKTLNSETLAVYWIHTV